MRYWMCIGLAVGALAGAGCSSPSSTAQQGVVNGHLVQTGGPSGGVARPVAGAVIAIAKGGWTKTAVVGSNGRFQLMLPTGRYSFQGTAQANSAQCLDAHAVVVTPNGVVSTQVVCPIR